MHPILAAVFSVSLKDHNLLLYELHHCTSWKELTCFVLERLHTLLRADRTSWAEFRGKGIVGYNEWSKEARHLQERYTPIISRLVPTQNPLSQTVGLGNFWDSCFRVTDLVSQTGFEKTELYNEGYKPTLARYQLALQISLSKFGFNVVSFWRWSKDFSEEEREFLNLMLPHLRLVYDRLMSEQRMQEASSRSLGLKEDSRLCFAFDKEMYLRDADESIVNMFESMSGFDGGVVPEEIAQAIGDGVLKDKPIDTSLCISGKSYRISGAPSAYQGYRYVSLQPIESGMAVSESPDGCEYSSLTRRQREIAIWIKRGKSNPEIAQILGISPRTVAKHVENIFRVLGVESRYSFMANF